MVRQSDVMDMAVRDFARRFENEGVISAVKRCGMNLDVYSPTPCTACECGLLIMDSYETPIARVDLGKRRRRKVRKMLTMLWRVAFFGIVWRCGWLTTFLRTLP